MWDDVLDMRTSKVYCLQFDCHLKLLKVWGVPEELPCVIVIVNSLFLLMIIKLYKSCWNKSLVSHEEMTGFEGESVITPQYHYKLLKLALVPIGM